MVCSAPSCTKKQVPACGMQVEGARRGGEIVGCSSCGGRLGQGLVGGNLGREAWGGQVVDRGVQGLGKGVR